jgi:4-amino-4-deoxychorismate lyase
MIVVDGNESDHLPVTDRSIQYGDGIWETFRVRQGKIMFLLEHMQRLKQGADVLGLDYNEQTLIDQLIAKAQQWGDGVLKLIISRGSGGRGYAPPSIQQARQIISFHPLPDYPEVYKHAGVRLGLCETRLAHQPLLAGFKHLNRLEQVLARQELSPEFQEGIVRDYADNIIEGTMSNVFFLKNNEVFTPDLSQCGIKGVVRNWVLKTLGDNQHNVQVSKQVKLRDLLEAEAIFLTNSVIGVWAVKSFQNREFPVVDLVKDLQAEFESCY